MNDLTQIETRSALPIETRNDPDPITAATAAVEELRTAATEFQTRQTNELRGLTERLAAVETRANRPAVTGNPTNEPTVETRAFVNFCRRGVARMEPDEARALNVSTDTSGGYLATPQFLTELQRNLVQFSPVRQVARIAGASTGEIILPKRTGRMTAGWIGENAATPATEPSYDQQKLVVHELACHIDVSNRLLEDAEFNLESELAYDFAEEFGRAEGAAFVVGDGTNKPYGLLTDTDIPAFATGGVTVTADTLIDLFHQLPGAYASNATWAMNRSTIGYVRKLKTASGDYLWQDMLTAGNPPTILGRPVVEMPDMPDIGTANAVPIVFGDFKAGFRIFDRVSLSVLRDPFTVQMNGLVRFHARRRVGGGVTKAEAFRFLKITAA